jgi:hypothetical protein
MRVDGRAPAGSRFLFVVCLFVLAAAIFFNATLRDGHDWDGDFALYIMQAENIADGHQYTDTNFIPDPRNAIDPGLYPPGLPWLLAPVYRYYGLDVNHLKEVGIVGLLGFLLIFAYVAREFMEDRIAFVVTALFAIHPYIVGLKDTIYSEFPFMLFTYATLLLTDRLVRSRTAIARAGFATAGLGALLALCFLTRTVAVVLFPAVLLASVYGYRKVVNPVSGAVLIAVVIVAVARVWFPSDSGTYVGYFDQLSAGSLLSALTSYGWALNVLLEDQVLHLKLLEWLAVGGFLLLVVIGFVDRARRSPSVYEIFLVAYLALLLIFPVHLEPERYSLPAWPLLVVYGLLGAGTVGRWIGGEGAQRYASLAMALMLAIPFIDVDAKTTYGPIEYSVTDPRSVEVFTQIKEHLPADAVVLTRKPTIVGLFAARKASIWPDRFDEHDFWQYARDVHAQYVLQDVGNAASPAYFKSDRQLDAFIATHAASFQLVFHNDWFNLYRIDPASH